MPINQASLSLCVRQKHQEKTNYRSTREPEQIIIIIDERKQNSRFIELLNLKPTTKKRKPRVLTSQRPINLTNAEITIGFRNNYTASNPTFTRAHSSGGEQENRTSKTILMSFDERESTKNMDAYIEITFRQPQTNKPST